MRKRRTLLICAVCAASAIIASFAFRPSSQEPAYGGHSLSYWVAILGTDPEKRAVDYREAENAIDHIGVAALPFLVKWAHLEKPKWKLALENALFKAPFQPAQRVAVQMSERSLHRSMQLADGVSESFRILGKRAMPALDDLRRILNDRNFDSLRALTAIDALACLGTNALPALLGVATNETHPSRWQALYAVSQMPDLGDAAQEVMMVITNYVTDTNAPWGQQAEVIALGNLKALPQVSVPAIASCLQSPDAGVRASAAEALGKFGPLALGVVPALTSLSADASPSVRVAAAKALHEIASETSTNLPANR